jgi:hypothetical protein
MRVISAVLTVALLGVAAAASAQTPGSLTSTASETTTQGTVISSSRSTLVVRTDGDEYRLFELTPDTAKPPALPVASGVEVTSYPSEVDGAAKATRVRVTKAAPPLVLIEDGVALPQDQAAQVPPDLRRLEKSIERQTSRYRIGARAGMALDPELVMLGAQAQIGPFFQDNMWGRPSLELGFGEVTTLLGINLDGVYRLPVTPATGRWSSFFGAGVGFNFINRGFSDQEDDERFDFDDFIFDAGLNLMAGVQARSGMFIELRAGVYSEPHLRLVLGYNLW